MGPRRSTTSITSIVATRTSLAHCVASARTFAAWSASSAGGHRSTRDISTNTLGQNHLCPGILCLLWGVCRLLICKADGADAGWLDSPFGLVSCHLLL